jgi:type IV fimbrial biogenesis protein FimT
VNAIFSARRRSTGFTLIELMIVLIIAGLAVTLALPGFRQLIHRQQLVTASNALFHAIQSTRTEAIRRNRIVQLAPLDDADWASGWRIYVSATGTGYYRKGDKLVARHDRLPAGLRIESHSSDPSQIYIAYNGGGHSTSRNRRGLSGHWQLHLKQESRIILINFQGRARICNPATDKHHCIANSKDYEPSPPPT